MTEEQDPIKEYKRRLGYTTFTVVNVGGSTPGYTSIGFKCDNCIKTHPDHISFIALTRLSNTITFDGDTGTLMNVMTFNKKYGECNKCDRQFVTAKQLADIMNDNKS